MEPSDITILMLTGNRLKEAWAEFHKEKLLEAAGSKPIITMSFKPMDWGINVLQDGQYSSANVYRQMLKGAKMASTEFIGIAEDDTIYPREHFEFKPPEDTFAYNINRFNLFNWGTPTYYWKDRVKNSTLIAPRKLMIEALEERFAKYPNGTLRGATGELGRRSVEDKLGLTHRKMTWFSSDISIISIDHESGIDRLARTHRKGMGILQAYDIPYWGRAEDMIKKFNG